MTGVQTCALPIFQYAEGVSAPNLFNDGPAAGKTTYDGYKLKFNRDGDTYTLSEVTGDAQRNVYGGFYGNQHLESLTGLEKLKVLAYQSSMKVPVPSNSFWPMDNVPAENRKDILFGLQTSEGKASQKFQSGPGENDQSLLPVSDDKADHNCFFGKIGRAHV